MQYSWEVIIGLLNNLLSRYVPGGFVGAVDQLIPELASSITRPRRHQATPPA
jgi:hypothetical protein